jgi:glycosyltransferase involved in cell wall biosynthesis
MKKLAVITSHPIQYNAPLFRLLSERKNIELKVFYTWGQTKDGNVYDPDFKTTFTWDIPLLDGYEKEFIENISSNPGASHFKGIMNKNLIERIHQYHPDAVLIYGWSFQSHLKAIRCFSGKKNVLFRGDSTLLDESPGLSIKKIARRVFLKWVYSHIDIALYTGESNKQYFLKHGVAGSKLKYAPHAIDNNRFADNGGSLELKAAKWRNELHIPADAIVFLFAGKLEAKKNVQLLVECFMEIKQENTRLVIAGTGELEERLKQLASPDERIIFLGFQNQQMMPLVYRLGNVFVLPSQGPGETWGLSANEAMACGRSVIVSDRCGCAANLGYETGGYVFKSNDRAGLMNIMMKFVKREIAYEKTAVQNSIMKYSFKDIAETIESII